LQRASVYKVDSLVINFTDPALGAINTDDTQAITRLHDQLGLPRRRSSCLIGNYIGGLEAKAALLSLDSGRPIDGDTLSG
jgi:hypothetical protein